MKNISQKTYRKACLALFYENGVLNIGAHRESVQYDDNTKKVIQNDYQFILDEVEEEMLFKGITAKAIQKVQPLFSFSRRCEFHLEVCL